MLHLTNFHLLRSGRVCIVAKDVGNELNDVRIVEIRACHGKGRKKKRKKGKRKEERGKRYKGFEVSVYRLSIIDSLGGVFFWIFMISEFC